MLMPSTPHPRRALVVLPLACILLAVVACGSAAANTGSPAPGTAPASSHSTPAPTPTPQQFTVGQAVAVGNTWIMTVVSATTSVGSTYNQPQQAGDVFLVFDVSAKNVGAAEQTISSLAQFTLLDAASGQKATVAYDSDAPASLDGKVEVGQTLRGSLVFEVPASAHHFTLGFEADPFSPGQTLWQISV